MSARYINAPLGRTINRFAELSGLGIKPAEEEQEEPIECWKDGLLFYINTLCQCFNFVRISQKVLPNCKKLLYKITYLYIDY